MERRQPKSPSRARSVLTVGSKPLRQPRGSISSLEIGLSGPFILYACSSPEIAPEEIELIIPWALAIRQQGQAQLRDAAILIRPHPLNPQPWDKLLSLTLQNLNVWNQDAERAFEEDGRQQYFDSLFHSSAVVGLNTSAQVEAGLLGRPVLTLLDPSIPQSTHGTLDTLHFHHLINVNGGLLHVAYSLGEHMGQLVRAILDPSMAERSHRFTESFIRPLGLGQAAAPILAQAIIELHSEAQRRPRGISDFLAAQVRKRMWLTRRA